MIAAWLVALTLAFAQEPQQDAPPRSVADLPRAQVGRWDGWSRAKRPELQPDYEAAARAYALGDLVPAEAQLHALLQRAPDYPAALHLYGVVEYALGRNGEAVAAFERFLEHAPEQLGRTRHLGHCLYGLGRYDDARAHYTRLLTARPDDWRARRGLGLTELRSFRYAAALVALEAVLEAQPDDPDAQYWLAFARFDQGDQLEQALREAHRATELAPHAPRAAYLVAQIAAELSDEELAGQARARFEQLEAVEARARPLVAQLRHAPRRLDLWRALVELREAAGDLGAAGVAAGRMARFAEALGDAARLSWARAAQQRAQRAR